MITDFTRSVVGAALVVGALAGCSDAADPTAPGAAGAASSSASPSAQPDSTATAAAPSPTTPAPVSRGVPVQVPVERPGALPEAERLAAPVVPFDGRAVYEDGVSLAVRGVSHGTTSETGAGAQPGQPVTTLTLELRNGSAVPVDLNGVVVSAVSGTRQAPAAPVYGEGQQDFSGVARPGAAVAAAYSFTIPASELDEVAVTVDFDGRHAPAVWRGSLR